jgi:hypothetical protein
MPPSVQNSAHIGNAAAVQSDDHRAHVAVRLKIIAGADERLAALTCDGEWASTALQLHKNLASTHVCWFNPPHKPLAHPILEDAGVRWSPPVFLGTVRLGFLQQLSCLSRDRRTNGTNQTDKKY